MANDYRYDPFQNVSEAVTISGETHVIPSASPYTIRLNEVPLKETPSSISLTIAGTAGAEVSAAPATGEFWPDYSTGADSDDNWNTGTILFNSADAGKTVAVSYIGTGTLADMEKIRGLHQYVKITSSGDWICPDGISSINVLLIGGGGGGVGSDGLYNYTSGGNGGDSKLGSLLTAGGGKGGKESSSVVAGTVTNSLTIPIMTAQFIVGAVGAKGTSGTKTGSDATGYGNSGGGAYTMSTLDGVRVNTAGAEYQSSGGGCAYALDVPVVAGTTYTVTIGAGGIGGDDTYDGGAGAPGLCMIWY